MTFRLAMIGVDHPHGAGWRELILNMDADIEFVAVVPRFEGGLASLEEQLANLPRFETTAQLVEWGRFDGALVCLPNDEGPGTVQQLAEAGKHVLAEKPLAGSVSAVSAALDAVDLADVAFQTGYMWRYDDCTNRLRRMVTDGQFGKLINVEMTFVTSDVTRRGPSHYLFHRERSGAGFFNWLACHYLDLLLYVTDADVTAVTARTGVWGDEPVEVEDGGAAIIELSNGALATFVGGYWLPRWAGEAHWTVRGSQRWVDWLPGVDGGRLEIHGPKPQWHAMEEVFKAGADDTPGYGGRLGSRLVADWLDATTNKRTCRNSTHSTRQTLKLLDLIAESSARGQRIEVR